MYHLLSLFLVFSILLSPLGAKDNSASLAPITPAGIYTETDYLRALGWALSVQGQIRQLGLSDAELEELLTGLRHAMKDSAIPECLSSPGFHEFLQTKAKIYTETHTQELQNMISENTKLQEDFLANLEKQTHVHKTESGLYYEVLQAGTGPYPDLGSWVSVHYTGQLVNGKVFDSSVQRGEPIRFDLEGVIPGFQEGLQLINKKGKIRLYIPSDLAYGSMEQPGIPAGSLLIFDVELLDFGSSK